MWEVCMWHQPGSWQAWCGMSWSFFLTEKIDISVTRCNRQILLCSIFELLWVVVGSCLLYPLLRSPGAKSQTGKFPLLVGRGYVVCSRRWCRLSPKGCVVVGTGSHVRNSFYSADFKRCIQFDLPTVLLRDNDWTVDSVHAGWFKLLRKLFFLGTFLAPCWYWRARRWRQLVFGCGA